MTRKLLLRTGAWYSDRHMEVDIPPSWNVTIHAPHTSAPLTDDQIFTILEKPTGQAPLSKILKGKSAPLIIVDDLNRPTPAERVMPFLLKYFHDAKIKPSSVTILMATGSHGKPPTDAFAKKIGDEAARSCNLMIHNCFHNVTKIGTTSFGTPVYVNKAVLNSDLVIGIGGIYPNHTAGFGGGSKLMLGLLGMRSIFQLHFRHQPVGWGSDGYDSDFRKDLNEIADMIGFNTSISLLVNDKREIFHMYCGNYNAYYRDAVELCRKTFSTPPPSDADVVISNTYPNDLSLTFARIKGFAPLYHSKPGASRIAIAVCSEGIGRHNIFPFLDIPRFHRLRHLMRRILTLSRHDISQVILHRINRFIPLRKSRSQSDRFNTSDSALHLSHPIVLYRPGKHTDVLPSNIPNLTVVTQWSDVLKIIAHEQEHRSNLKVVVYPCAFLQVWKSDIDSINQTDNLRTLNSTESDKNVN